MTNHIARDVVLDLASEDFYGLWEVIWRLRELRPGADDVELMACARSAVGDLAHEGAIKLYSRESIYAEPKELLGDSDSVLADSTRWQEPTSKSAPVVLIGT